MKLIKSIIPIICFSVFTTLTYGQVYKNSGTLITSSLDTLEVIIKSGYQVQNKYQVVYKEIDSNSGFITASPENVLAYFHDKDSYRSFSVNGEKIFLRNNIIGYASLYETNDLDGSLLFYIKKQDEDFKQITEASFPDFVDNYFTDCQKTELTQDLRKARFTRFRIANIVSEYNACKFPDRYVSASFKPQRHVKLTVLAGLEYSTLEYNFALLSPASTSKTSPFIGLSLLFEGERRVSSGLEINYAKYQYDINFEESLPENLLGADNVRDFENTKLNVSVFARYKPIENKDLYLRVGPTFSFLESIPEGEFQREILTDPNTLLVGAILGLSYQFSNKFGIQLDYKYARGSGVILLQNNIINQSTSFAFRYKLN